VYGNKAFGLTGYPTNSPCSGHSLAIYTNTSGYHPVVVALKNPTTYMTLLLTLVAGLAFVQIPSGRSSGDGLAHGSSRRGKTISRGHTYQRYGQISHPTKTTWPYGLDRHSDST
jgi:hypothetical protein